MGETQNPLFVGVAGVERNEDFVEGNVVDPQRQPRPHRPRGIVFVSDHELQSHLEKIPCWFAGAGSSPRIPAARSSQDEPEQSCGVKLRSPTFLSPYLSTANIPHDRQPSRADSA